MNRSASAIGKTVRPKGPVGPSFFPERPVKDFEPVRVSGWTQARHRRPRLGIVESVARVAALREQSPSGAAELLDTLMIGSSIAANNRQSQAAMSRAIVDACRAVRPCGGTLARPGRCDSKTQMTPKCIESIRPTAVVPPVLVSWLAVFRPCFTAPVWNRILVLVAGAVLAPMGLADQPGFGRYHEALNQARWASEHASEGARDVSRRLLLHLLAVLW
jgi:hypothetical protein